MTWRELQECCLLIRLKGEVAGLPRVVLFNLCCLQYRALSLLSALYNDSGYCTGNAAASEACLHPRFTGRAGTPGKSETKVPALARIFASRTIKTLACLFPKEYLKSSSHPLLKAKVANHAIKKEGFSTVSCKIFEPAAWAGFRGSSWCDRALHTSRSLNNSPSAPRASNGRFFSS